jgi:hypothetical protein
MPQIATVVPHPTLIEKCSGELLIALKYWGRKWSEATIAAAEAMAARGAGPLDAPAWAGMLDRIEADLETIIAETERSVRARV